MPRLGFLPGINQLRTTPLLPQQLCRQITLISETVQRVTVADSLAACVSGGGVCFAGGGGLGEEFCGEFAVEGVGGF